MDRTLLKEISDAFCKSKQPPVLWRLHPETLYKIAVLDREFSYLHYDSIGNKKLCGLPIEIDAKLNGWELYVNCINCDSAMIDLIKLIEPTFTVDRNGKCFKCHGANILLEAKSNAN